VSLLIHYVPSFIGELEIRGLRLESGALPEPVEVTGLKLTASPQELSLAPFQNRAWCPVRPRHQSPCPELPYIPMLELEARTEAARIEDLLKVAESFGLRPISRARGSSLLVSVSKPR
jgi:hypothetical protein